MQTLAYNAKQRIHYANAAKIRIDTKMKIKEFKNFKTKSLPELRQELRAREEKLTQLRFDLAAGKVKNIREIRHIKKDIAQIITLIKFSQNHA